LKSDEDDVSLLQEATPAVALHGQKQQARDRCGAFRMVYAKAFVNE
jgi:hypothetical protein